jgi:hypothetical protein
MKTNIIFLALSFVSIFLLQSCGEDCQQIVTYTAYVPVYKSSEELLPKVSYIAQRELKKPGKIYYYGNYILINEQNEGVHIIDNSNLKAPIKIGFISIEGNIDIALRDNYIYADDFYNLLVIDISTITDPKIVSHIPNLKDEVYFDDVRQAFLVDYEMLEEKTEVACGEEAPFEIEKNGIYYYNYNDLRIFNDVAFADKAAVPSTAGGGGGSLARVAFIKDNFYYVNNFSMKIFDASNLSKPELINTVYLDWGVETIFPYENYIFIGANDGMHIMDNSDPANPVYVSTFRHARACDPVVVEGTTAYVTLRDGTECQNFINQLDVVDVSNIKEPKLIASYDMHHPHGLSVINNTLYLCEGDEGLKIFDVTQVEEITKHLLSEVKDYDAYDVISITKDLLLMVGKDGFYQFDTSDPKDVKLLSSIKIGS